jgi:nucleoside-diphosphate-sugar epimerase
MIFPCCGEPGAELLWGMHLLLIGNGYLGQAITREFRENGGSVSTVTLSGEDGSIRCDIGQADEVKRLPRADFIVHCAASGRGGAAAYQHVYVAGCQNLCAAFPGTPLLFTSSTSVYAQIDGSVVTETSPAIPDRETGSLLLEAERITLASGGMVTRLAGIYGPGRSMILKKLLCGEAVIEEDGRRLINQIHRDDAARAIYHLANSEPLPRGEIFNLCDSEALAQGALFKELSRQFSLPVPSSGPRDLDRKRGWTHKQVSNQKLRNHGWTPRFPSFLQAAEEVAQTLSW